MQAECKTRHIKCDETTPRCINCVTASKKCSFEKDPKLATRPTSPKLNRHTATGLPSPMSYGTVSPRPVDSTLPTANPSLNLEHLHLLHHFCTRTYTTFTDNTVQKRVWNELAVQHGFQHRFLMFELLAVASLHLASENTARKEYYLHQATILQSAAMTEFNSIQEGVTQDNCAATLLFSSLLALHVLADPTRTTGLDLHGYIDHLIRCIKLMRGVRNVVISDWWEYLSSSSDIRSILVIDSPQKPYKLPPEVSHLQNLTNNSELSERAIEGYNAAIDKLHWLYALSDVPSRTYDTARWVLAWPIQLQDEYLDLLNKRRPEAMVILCYYAAVLYHYRECWVVGQVGVYLIKAICAHLGGYWDEWLKWPRELVADESFPEL